MPRILISVVCAYWIVVFGLRSAAAWGIAGAASADAFSVVAFGSVACMLVAALFLWLAIASLFGGEHELSDIAAAAISTAIMTAAALALAGSPLQSQLSDGVAAQICTLCVSYLVVRSIEQTDLSIPVADFRHGQAREMAVAAAHNTSLAWLSGRAEDKAGSEA